MQLDKKDREILFELDKNSRYPISKIAKKTKLSKQVAKYRVDKLIKEGIITNFSSVINLSYLGIGIYKIYFQLSGISKEKLIEIINDLKKNYKINWIAECIGRFDLIIAILCKNPQEFYSEKKKILLKYNQYIHEYEISITSDTYIYGRNYLVDKEIQGEEQYIGQKKLINLDSKDKKILEILINNCRITSLEISKITKFNIKTVISRIRNLEKLGIIARHKLFLDLNKIDLKYYKVVITINNMILEDYNKFINYCKNNRNIVFLVETIGSWELEFEVEIENEDKLFEIIKDIKSSFPNFIKRLEYLRIIKDHKYIYLPKELIEKN
ncbi:MAG: Lrp/AsnC family transcriptional regulator [archaeon]